MPEAHAKFHSTDGKRRVLVVEDERINREILGAILSDSYEVAFAEDGVQAMEVIRENGELLSLVLLDLIMPNMSGQEVLAQIKADPELMNIPVIVATSDQSQEIECLDAGASDFITKPYPNKGIILARIRRTIELSEGKRIIASTERDPLTGLYNREYFYSYAEQYDMFHKDTPMDAIVLDIDHFSIIRERHGRAYADEVVRQVGEKAREMVRDDGGIVCRGEQDVFQVYCPHRKDYKAILDNASQGLLGEHDANNRIQLRMGVYSNVDKSLDIERRFDRARMASESVRNSYTRNIGVYDDTLQKSELYSAQLLEDFPEALAEGQFRVYYQPKFDIRPDEPMLESAEGLVRWEHPELGLINPGVFIPLFEENGLIRDLDNYVWEETARQIREWKDRYGFSVPVSVNVSRIDMYDANIVMNLMSLLEKYHLDAGDLRLEVTESAYAEDSEQIVEAVKRLRSIGFAIEMDDFGTGYSSLNMLNTLPIDTLKLDLLFIRTSFADERNTKMLEIMVEIADSLSVPIVAEGVEEEEQLRSLREAGCDIVQGFYFSAPVPAREFEVFLDEMKRIRDAGENVRRSIEKKRSAADHSTGLAGDHLGKGWSRRFNIPLRGATIIFFIAALVAAVCLFTSNTLVTRGYIQIEQANERFILAEQTSADLEMGSDYLTEQVRLFVTQGDIKYLHNFFEELEVTKRRDKAVSSLQRLLDGTDNAAYRHLAEALRLSNELVGYEYHAMKLILETGDYNEKDIPKVLQDYTLSIQEAALSNAQKEQMAETLVLGATYNSYKIRIKNNTAECSRILLDESEKGREEADGKMNSLLTIQTAMIFLLLLIVLAIVVFISIWVRRPLSRMVTLMKAKETVPPAGAEELRFVSETYNSIFEENRKTHERLTYGNMHDALTGLYNRNAYDVMCQEIDMSHNALLLVDVDLFKSINDTFGHDVGDLVLKRVAEVLEYNFRSTDLVFRLGGDEFVIIMTMVDNSMQQMVRTKIEQANVMLQQPEGDLPPTSLSVGVAFADRDNPEGDIFKDADTALYRMKESGRCGCYIY